MWVRSGLLSGSFHSTTNDQNWLVRNKTPEPFLRLWLLGDGSRTYLIWKKSLFPLTRPSPYSQPTVICHRRREGMKPINQREITSYGLRELDTLPWHDCSPLFLFLVLEIYQYLTTFRSKLSWLTYGLKFVSPLSWIHCIPTQPFTDSCLRFSGMEPKLMCYPLCFVRGSMSLTFYCLSCSEHIHEFLSHM